MLDEKHEFCCFVVDEICALITSFLPVAVAVVVACAVAFCKIGKLCLGRDNIGDMSGFVAATDDVLFVCVASAAVFNLRCLHFRECSRCLSPPQLRLVCVTVAAAVATALLCDL